MIKRINMNPMPFIINTQVLQKDSSILIVGARDTSLAQELVKHTSGTITLIDIRNLIDAQNLPDRCKFFKTSLESFVPEEKYDIVICRHVLPFTKHIWEAFTKVLSFGNNCFITFFGDEHEWKQHTLVSMHEVDAHLGQEHPNIQIIFKADHKGRMRNYRNEPYHGHDLIYLTSKKSD